MKKFNHLTKEERDKIAVLKAQDLSTSQIGAELGRDKSTISRELRRNKKSNNGEYLSGKAEEIAKSRWSSRHKKERLKSPEIREYVEEKLKLGWSPELISGRLKIDKPGLSISHEAIYQYIYKKKRISLVFSEEA